MSETKKDGNPVFVSSQGGLPVFNPLALDLHNILKMPETSKADIFFKESLVSGFRSSLTAESKRLRALLK